jgi:hypothetical protein
VEKSARCRSAEHEALANVAPRQLFGNSNAATGASVNTGEGGVVACSGEPGRGVEVEGGSVLGWATACTAENPAVVIGGDEETPSWVRGGESLVGASVLHN